MFWQYWAGRAGPKSFSCRTTQIIFMHVSPIFGSGYLVLLVCSLHVEPSPWPILPLAGERSHCCPWFGEFKDPQCSERRCRTISMCSQEQPRHSLFETRNGGSGRWVIHAVGSMSTCQLLVHTCLTWINLKYHINGDKNILGRDSKGRRRERKGKQSEKQRKFVHTCSHCRLMVKGTICGRSLSMAAVVLVGYLSE